MSGLNQPTRLPLGLRLFFGIFIVVGLIALGVGVSLLVRGLRCESWPTVAGVIVSSEMKSSSNEHGTTYSANVSYNYQVARTHYNSTRLAFGAMSASSFYARGILDRYPVGQSVRVYYSPADPGTAVLEPGIHGGTWVCFGVGVIFALAGIMMWQLFSAASRASLSSAVTTAMPRSVPLQQPPVLMGVIFIIMGSAVCFGDPAANVPKWILCAAGGMFVLAGGCLLASRLQNKLCAKILGAAALLAFLAIFHWVSFAPGERIGTSTTPFSMHSGVNVKTPFAVFTVIMDLLILVTLTHRLLKRRKD